MVVIAVVGVVVALNLFPREQQGSWWNAIDSKQWSLGWPFRVYVRYDEGYIGPLSTIGVERVYETFSGFAVVADLLVAVLLAAGAAFVAEFLWRRRMPWTRS